MSYHFHLIAEEMWAGTVHWFAKATLLGARAEPAGTCALSTAEAVSA